jgi:hypothetical protein
MKNYQKPLNRQPRPPRPPRPETEAQPALANVVRRVANFATRVANAVIHRQQPALGAGVAVAQRQQQPPQQLRLGQATLSRAGSVLPPRFCPFKRNVYAIKGEHCKQ